MKTLLGEKLRFDWRIVTITIVSTLLLVVDAYRRLTPNPHFDGVILYLIIPLMIIVILFREHPRDYGFTLGDWKAGLVITVLGIIFMTPIIYYVGRGDEGMSAFYKEELAGLPWTTFLDLIGWEFIFRGWILFGYARKFGAEALWLQAVPFALAHLGKPEIETLSTIFGGFAFGWIAWRTKSFVWPLLIHWYIATLIILAAAGVV